MFILWALYQINRVSNRKHVQSQLKESFTSTWGKKGQAPIGG